MKFNVIFPAAIVLLLASAAAIASENPTDILANGTGWSYYRLQGQPTGDWANGSGSAGWKQGFLPIGYSPEDGGKDIATIFSTNKLASKKYPVAYFRKSFKLPANAGTSGLNFTMGCDDGCIAYLNGVEIGRIRIRTNVVGLYDAQSWHGEPAETFAIPAKHLKSGINMLAVEVHQADPRSSDMVFLTGRLSVNSR